MIQITMNKQTNSKTNQARRFDAIASATLECEFCGVELNDSTGVVANADGQLFCSDECCTDGAMWQEVEKLYAEREYVSTRRGYPVALAGSQSPKRPELHVLRRAIYCRMPTRSQYE